MFNTGCDVWGSVCSISFLKRSVDLQLHMKYLRAFRPRVRSRSRGVSCWRPTWRESEAKGLPNKLILT